MLEVLRESEARFRAMADSAPVLITMTDEEAQCVYVNRGWVDLTGRTREDLRGGGWLQSIHPGDRSGYLEAFQRACRERTQFSVESRLRRSDGIFRWTLLRGAPRLAGPQGGPGYIVFGVDIEERRRAEARRITALATTRIFAESAHAETAIPRLLAAVGQGLEYDCAELWLLDQGATSLSLSDAWPSLHFLAGGEPRAIPPATCGRGVGLPGAVWDSQAMTLVSQPERGMDHWASASSCAVGVPVLGTDAEFQGVLVFRASHCHRIHEELEFLSELASRLGQFLDHRRAEAVSQASVALRSAVLDSLPANVALVDQAGMVLTVNEAWKQFASANGWKGPVHPAALNYLDVCDRAVGPGAEEARAAASGIRTVLAGTARRFELRYACQSPTEQRWFRMIVVPLPERLGSGAVLMHLDITAGVLAEQALSASETRYRLLARATSDAIYEWDIRAGRWTWSEGVGRVLGYRDPEFSGTWWRDRVHVEDRERILRHLDEALAGSAAVWTGVYRFRRADDSYCFVADRGYIVRDERGQAVRMIGAISDITQRKQAEHQIRRSEATLAAAQTVARVGSWELDLHDGSAIWSAEMYHILGLEHGTGPVPTSLLLDRVHPEDRALLTDRLRDALEAGISEDLHFRIVRPDGTVRHVHARTQLTRNAAGIPEYSVGAIQDVTEQREAEQKLVQREHRLRLLNSIATGLRGPATTAQVIRHVVHQLHGYFPDCRATYSSIDHDLRLRVIECAHPANMADLTGVVADLPRGPSYLAALRRRGPIVVEQPDLNPEVAPVLQGRPLGSATVLVMPLLQLEQPIGMLTLSSAEARVWGDHEHDILREVGDYLRVAIAEARAEDERAQAVAELELSRAQLRDLARQLQVARERERTRIAREIHDVLGQALTALHMETALLVQRRLADRSEGEKLLSLIDGTIDSVQRLSADLRPSVLDDLDLTAAVLWQAGELQSRTGVRCECHVPEEVGALKAEQSTAIFRVLQEALTNVARHSKADTVRITLEVDGRVVRLTVADNGTGVSDDALDNPRSLGIVGMRERALALNGRLDIESRFGRGTRLTLELPLDGAQAARAVR
jgi:PAS domain S-box-containing protein